MDARLDYLGNPLALKLVKHINSAEAVMHKHRHNTDERQGNR